MPYSHAWEDRGVVKHFSGFVTGEEFARSAQEIAADRRFDDLRFIICDFLDVKGHSIDARSIERIAITRLGSLYSNPNIRVVLITTDEKVAKLKLAIEHPRFGKTYETCVFGTVQQARDWLGSQAAMHEMAKRFNAPKTPRSMRSK